MRIKLDLNNVKIFEPVNTPLPSIEDINHTLYQNQKCIAEYHHRWQREKFILQWEKLVHIFCDIVKREMDCDLFVADINEAEFAYVHSIGDRLIIEIATSMRDPHDGLLPNQEPIVFSQLKSSLEMICVYCINHPGVARTKQLLNDLHTDLGNCGPGLFMHLQQAVWELFQPAVGLHYWLANFRTLIVRQYANQYVVDNRISSAYEVHPYVAFLDYAEIQGWHLLTENINLKDHFVHCVIPKEEETEIYEAFDHAFKERYASEALSYLTQCVKTFLLEKFYEGAVSGKLSSQHITAFNRFFEEMNAVFHSFGLSIESFLTPVNTTDEFVVYSLNDTALSLLEIYLAICLHDLHFLDKKNLRVLTNKHHVSTFLFSLTDDVSFIVICAYSSADKKEKTIEIPTGCIRIKPHTKLLTLEQYLKNDSSEKLFHILHDFLEEYDANIPLFLTLLKQEPQGLVLYEQLLKHALDKTATHLESTIEYAQLTCLINYLVKHAPSLMLNKQFALSFFPLLMKDSEQLHLLSVALYLAQQAPPLWHTDSLQIYYNARDSILWQFCKKLFELSRERSASPACVTSIAIVKELAKQLPATVWLYPNRFGQFQGSSAFWWCCRLFTVHTCLDDTAASLMENFLDKIPSVEWTKPVGEMRIATPLHFFCIALNNHTDHDAMIHIAKKLIDRLPVEAWLMEFEQIYNLHPQDTDQPTQRRRGENHMLFRVTAPFQAFLGLLGISHAHSMTAIDKLSILLHSDDFAEFLQNHLGIDASIQNYFKEKYNLQPLSRQNAREVESYHHFMMRR